MIGAQIASLTATESLTSRLLIKDLPCNEKNDNFKYPIRYCKQLVNPFNHETLILLSALPADDSC